MSLNKENKGVRKAILRHENIEIDLMILKNEDGSYEVQGSGIRVTAKLKQGKKGSEQLQLSGKGAKKFKQEILHALQQTEAGGEIEEQVETQIEKQIETQKEPVNVTLTITENDMLGYDITGTGVEVTARIKQGKTNSAFGWEGYELSGLGAETYKQKILDAIEDYRMEHDLNPLYALPPQQEAKVGEVVRVIANMYISKQQDGKLGITPEKDAYVGALAKVVDVHHSFQYGTRYSLEFLDPSLQETQLVRGNYMFYQKEIVVVEQLPI